LHERDFSFHPADKKSLPGLLAWIFPSKNSHPIKVWPREQELFVNSFPAPESPSFVEKILIIGVKQLSPGMPQKTRLFALERLRQVLKGSKVLVFSVCG
jgi:hypothetical protein